MPHQDKSQKCYLDLGINLEWPQARALSFAVLWVGRTDSVMKNAKNSVAL